MKDFLRSRVTLGAIIFVLLILCTIQSRLTDHAQKGWRQAQNQGQMNQLKANHFQDMAIEFQMLYWNCFTNSNPTNANAQSITAPQAAEEAH